MKKIIFLLLFLSASIIINAQKIQIKDAYTYSHLLIQNKDMQTSFNEDITGGIIFSMKNRDEFIAISIEKDICYYGKIVKVETEYNMISYEFNALFNGAYIPIVLSVIYDTPNHNVPSKFFLTVLNRFSRDPVKYNLFTGITKAKYNK